MDGGRVVVGLEAAVAGRSGAEEEAAPAEGEEGEVEAAALSKALWEMGVASDMCMYVCMYACLLYTSPSPRDRG